MGAFAAGLSLLVAALLAAGMLYQLAGLAADARRFPVPGRRFDIGGRSLHARISGEGSPAVILESGIAASSLNWSAVELEVARFTRVVSYDRGGFGWSDPAPPPLTASRLVEDLRALLAAAGVPPPYVLVGHSFGSLLARLYASRYPGEATGIVLVDPIDTREWTELTPERRRMLRGGAALSRLGALLAALGVVRALLGLASGGRPHIPALFVRIFGPAVVTVLVRIIGEVRKLPAELVPVAQALWCRPKCFRAMADHLAALPASAAEAASAALPPTVPVVVLAAAGHEPEELRVLEALAALSQRGRCEVVDRSGHWIQLDRPDRVIIAIREVVAAAQQGNPLVQRPHVD